MRLNARDLPPVSSANYCVNFEVLELAQAASSTPVVFVNKSDADGWVTVSGFERMICLFAPDTTNCSVTIEYKRSDNDPSVQTLVPTSAVVAGNCAEIYKGTLNYIYKIRILISGGTSPNTAFVSLFAEA